MSAVAATAAPAATDYASLTKPQKLAALLVMLGPDSAAPILKQLDPPTLEAVSAEMARLTLIDQDLQHHVLREFSQLAVEAGTALRGGVEFAQNALEKALGQFKASHLLTRVAPLRGPSALIGTLADLDGRDLFNVLKHEQPQTLALVVSYLAPPKASQLLMLLPEATRDQVIERLATLAPTPVSVVEKIVEVISQRLGARPAATLHQTGGVKSAADLLNALKKDASKTLLTTIEERNPELGQAIRQKMFIFDDLARLDVPSLQKILREVDMRDLAMALKGAGDALKGKLLGCLSKRAAETVHEEISFMTSVKAKEVEAARLRIIDVLRRLENEGEIDLAESCRTGTDCETPT
jgi:flagellar motor switch protein FliG